MDTTIQDGRNDFDFFIGKWKIYNKMLTERLVKADTWIEFEGQLACRKMLGGLGNIDDCIMDLPSGQLHCLTLRTFNFATQEWSLYWADSRRGTVGTPMIGKFTDGRGYFYDHDTYNNQHIFSRFIWSDITESTCHWEQAYSVDGGQSWETNWTMDFVRQE